MADVRFQQRTGVQTQAEVDTGLRSYMLGVYNYMALGVALTAAVILAVASNPALMATVLSLKWVFFIGVLGLGWFAPKLIFSGNTAMAHAAYWGYAALWGVLLAPMVAYYLGANPTIVFQAFLSTAITFGAASLVGYTTKRDMSGLAGFFTMAAIGLLVVMLANVFFFHSTMMSLVTSAFVVLLFSGITAYETQQIKEMYVEGDAAGIAKGKSIFGAFMLYGSFVTLFSHILSMLGIMGGGDE
jgi:uncharacterized protein